MELTVGDHIKQEINRRVLTKAHEMGKSISWWTLTEPSVMVTKIMKDQLG